ncbi:MAG: hypothetical protein WD834_06325 [Actinomycetota bacterium]
MAIRESPTGLDAAHRKVFERDGYVLLENALTADEVQRLTLALDTAYAEECIAEGASLHLLAFCGRDGAFLELLDHRSTLPLVIDVLGTNVYMYHCHLDVHPVSPGCGTRMAASSTVIWRPNRARASRSRLRTS